MDDMHRLIEYITIIGINETIKNDIESKYNDLTYLKNLSIEGDVLDRFPLVDHEDFPFPSGIIKFCIPNGWKIEFEQKRPLFYSVVLTDIDGIYSYAACLVWNEHIVKSANQNTYTNDVYVPKCICIISRLPYFDRFKECLIVIFTTLRKQYSLENVTDKYTTESIISQLISAPKVVDAGIEPFKLSLSNLYYIMIKPPLTTQFNSTGDNVYFLARHLGVHNLIRLFNVLLLDNKILFISSSYNFLFKACQGLISLLYPLKFNYVFIPLLPKHLMDIVNAPTPFIIGMHDSCFKELLVSGISNDIITVNIDTGEIKIDCEHNVPCIPNRYVELLEVGMSQTLFSELEHPDELFSKMEMNDYMKKDKKIRSYFLIFLLHLLRGYLSCTTVVRVHPTILIKFQKDQFLYKRKLQNCQFITKFLDTMIFNIFIAERGIPYRCCDIFDDLIMRYDHCIPDSGADYYLLITTITTIFMENEGINSEEKTNVSYIPDFEIFDKINPVNITMRDIQTDKVLFIDNKQCPGQSQYLSNSITKMARTKTFIPLDINSYKFGLVYDVKIIDANIVREFVKYIFGNQCPKALQIINKIKSLGEQPGIRVILCNELSYRLKQNYNQLDCVQFSLLCDVINTYLDNEDDGYCFIMSSLVADISNQFYKKTNNNIISMYTKFYNHNIWSCLSFWEHLFYISAQSQLIQFYLTTNKPANTLGGPLFDKQKYETYFVNECLTKFSNDATVEKVLHPTYYDINGVMPVIAQQLINSESFSLEQLEELEKMERDLLFSTTSLYISKILCMNLQLSEAHKYIHDQSGTKLELERISGNEITGKNYNYDNTKNTPINYKSIMIFLRKFISNVFMTLDFKFDTSSDMISKITEIMEFHCDALDQIYVEKENTSNDIKDIIKSPFMIPDEVVSDTFNCAMLPEGLQNCINVRFNSTSILPANGIMFVTQYRLNFYGYPVNPYTSNNVVSRSIPFGLIKCVKNVEENRCPLVYRKQLTISYCVQIFLKTGNCVFISFPHGTSQERIDCFNKIIYRRYVGLLSKLNQGDNIILDATESPYPGFDNTEKSEQDSVTLASCSRNSSIFDIQRETRSSITNEDEIIKLKSPKESILKFNMKKKLKKINVFHSKKNKPLFSDSNLNLSNTVSRSKSKLITTDFNSVYVSVFENGAYNAQDITPKFLSKLPYIYDYERMNISIIDMSVSTTIFIQCDWRLTLLNLRNMFPTLPEIFAVSLQITDENLFRLAKSFKSKRFPVLSWQCAKKGSDVGTDSSWPGAILRCASLVKCLNILSTKSQSSSTASKSISYNNNNTDLDNYFFNLVGLSSKIRIIHSIKHEKDSKAFQKSTTGMLYLEILEKLNRPHMLFLTSTQESYDVGDVSCQFSDLYIFGDKTFPKGVSEDKKISILNIDMPDAVQLESAFRKLCKSLTSNKQQQHDFTVSSHLKLLSQTKWFNYLKKLLVVSSTVAFVTEYGESFSIVGFGDGSEISAQINSLTQIMLDPFYRTIDGFKNLIEKEWLAFSHKFILRNGVTNQTTSPFYPVFLLFLDCVHQLTLQYPNAFEYNDYYLKFLAYHHLSNRFYTFVGTPSRSGFNESSHGDVDMTINSFSAKTDYNTITSEKIKDSAKVTDTRTGSQTNSQPSNEGIKQPSSLGGDNSFCDNTLSGISWSSDLGVCHRKESLWCYIDKYCDKYPIFYNTCYLQGMNTTLYAVTHLANIDLWDFYYQTPQLMNTDVYELENFNIELLIDQNFIFNFTKREFEHQYPSNDIVQSSNCSTDDNKKPYVFFNCSSYLGYILDDIPLIVDKFNHTLICYLQKYKYNLKISTMIDHINLTVPNKVSVCTSIEDNGTQNIAYELKYINYFLVLNIKRFFTSVISTDKSFYSKTINQTLDIYFSQVTHDFVEAPPSEHLVCSSCAKTLAGKYSYYTCLKCHLNIHTKCSKNISQLCNMGEISPKLPEPIVNRSKKLTLTKRFTLRRNKNRGNTLTPVSVDCGDNINHNTEKTNNNDSIDPSEKISVTSSMDSSPINSITSVKGFLYKYKSNMKKDKKYFVIDNVDDKLFIYESIPTAKHSAPLEEYNLSDLISCTYANYSNYKNNNYAASESTTNLKTDRETKLKNRISSCFPLYFEVKFCTRERSLILSAANDNNTIIWFNSFKKYVAS